MIFGQLSLDRPSRSSRIYLYFCQRLSRRSIKSDEPVHFLSVYSTYNNIARFRRFFFCPTRVCRIIESYDSIRRGLETFSTRLLDSRRTRKPIWKATSSFIFYKFFISVFKLLHYDFFFYFPNQNAKRRRGNIWRETENYTAYFPRRSTQPLHERPEKNRLAKH